MAGSVPAIVDSEGRIAKIKARMARDCAVRKSKYCDHIIALRMAGRSFYKIKDWLYDQDPEAIISVPTLSRNLKKAFRAEDAHLDFAQELAEKWGGDLSVDLERELEAQILTQRRRIDVQVRAEAQRQATRPGYRNATLRQEMETLATLLDQYTRLKGIGQSRPNSSISPDIPMQNQPKVEPGTPVLDQQSSAALVDMILTGKIKVQLPAPAAPQPRLVGSHDASPAKT